MPAVISAVLDWAVKNWHQLIVPAAALIVLAAVLYGAHLHGRVDALSRQLAAAQATNAADLKRIETIKANAASSARAVAADAATANARNQAVAAIKRNIYHAAPSQGDCTVVGPRLRAALDGLRSLQAADANPN